MRISVLSRRLLSTTAVLVLLLQPAAAWALGLGELEVYSSLNEKLDARIPVRASEKERLNLKLSYASQQDFVKAGLRYSDFYARELVFSIEEKNDGSVYAIITSKQPIKEPIFLILVRLESLSGSLLREYSALLDFKSRTGTAPEQAAVPDVKLPLTASPATATSPRTAAPGTASVVPKTSGTPATTTVLPPGTAATTPRRASAVRLGR